MLLRGGVLVGLGLALCLSAGCQQQARVEPTGDGVHLFGPTPLALGHESQGYFAYVPATEPPLMMLDSTYQSTFVRTRIWDIEDNRRPGRSYHRRRTYSEQIYSAYR